jgi:hypothetical protein
MRLRSRRRVRRTSADPSRAGTVAAGRIGRCRCRQRSGQRSLWGAASHALGADPIASKSVEPGRRSRLRRTPTLTASGLAAQTVTLNPLRDLERPRTVLIVVQGPSRARKINSLQVGQ